jgi:hypothetical protein
MRSIEVRNSRRGDSSSEANRLIGDLNSNPTKNVEEPNRVFLHYVLGRLAEARKIVGMVYDIPFCQQLFEDLGTPLNNFHYF